MRYSPLELFVQSTVRKVNIKPFVRLNFILLSLMYKTLKLTRIKFVVLIYLLLTADSPLPGCSFELVTVILIPTDRRTTQVGESRSVMNCAALVWSSDISPQMICREHVGSMLETLAFSPRGGWILYRILMRTAARKGVAFHRFNTQNWRSSTISIYLNLKFPLVFFHLLLSSPECRLLLCNGLSAIKLMLIVLGKSSCFSTTWRISSQFFLDTYFAGLCSERRTFVLVSNTELDLYLPVDVRQQLRRFSTCVDHYWFFLPGKIS